MKGMLKEEDLKSKIKKLKLYNIYNEKYSC